jgi:hypothetical protein
MGQIWEKNFIKASLPDEPPPAPQPRPTPLNPEAQQIEVPIIRTRAIFMRSPTPPPIETQDDLALIPRFCQYCRK